MQDLRSSVPALTTLSEEEQLFRDAVREFAETEVRPHVHAMDEAAQFRADLIPKFFELGLMGIEVPEEFGGAGGGIFMSALAIEHNAVNLGQGFPDEDGPLALREVAARALIDGPNQYPPMKGRIELRRAIAAHAKRFYDLSFDPDTEVVVTSGATEAIAASIMATI